MKSDKQLGEVIAKIIPEVVPQLRCGIKDGVVTCTLDVKSLLNVVETAKKSLTGIEPNANPQQASLKCGAHE